MYLIFISIEIEFEELEVVSLIGYPSLHQYIEIDSGNTVEIVPSEKVIRVFGVLDSAFLHVEQFCEYLYPRRAQTVHFSQSSVSR